MSRRKAPALAALGIAALATSEALCAPAASIGAQEKSTETVHGSTSPVAFATITPRIDVIWPREGDVFPHVERSFTFGSVTPGSTLTVNGALVDTSADGAFFAMVAFSTGMYALDYAVSWQEQSASTRRVVTVGPPYGLPVTGPGELLALEPGESLEVRAGDVIAVRCKGPPGLKGSFRIKGLTGALPLAERAGAVAGVYEGHYHVQTGDKAEQREVRCELKSGLWGGLSAVAPGKVTILGAGQTRTAATSGRATVLKSGEGGYSLFLPAGVKLEISGRRGEQWRVELSEHESGWVDAGQVQLLPEGTPPPRGRIGRYSSTEATEDSVLLSIEAEEKLPFEIRQTIEPLGFDIRFFGGAHRFDRIRYASGDPVIRDVRWRQESSRVVHVAVDTRLRLGWGYDARYDGEGHFILEIRRPPDLTRAENVLAGRDIVLDAGHGPSTSAVGPRGTTERDVNLAISEKLERLLTEDGANIYMIRRSSEGPALAERPFIAWERKGELFLSIHNNAFPVTADPFEKPRGFMHFYYHPQSRPLVEAVHRSYVKNHPELADEFVWWGDLQVCRTTQMPAVLTESAYVVLPEQERMLMDTEYQWRLAHTLRDGIKTFYRNYQLIQRKSGAEQAAAK